MTEDDDFCNICLSNTEIITEYDRLSVCSKCLDNIEKLEPKDPVKLSKEQIAGGIKDEL